MNLIFVTNKPINVFAKNLFGYPPEKYEKIKSSLKGYREATQEEVAEFCKKRGLLPLENNPSPLEDKPKKEKKQEPQPAEPQPE
jgi:hypothetical protein